MKKEKLDKNLFLMCSRLNRSALSPMPNGYYTRNCTKAELDIWKAMPFDDEKTARMYNRFMTDYFNDAYAPKGELFFSKCLFVCNQNDVPIATCFIWKAYDRINTLHWLKVVKGYEGRGIGRALLSKVLGDLSQPDFPIYLHTQPDSYRAIKLYSDFGFELISNPVIGTRKNDLYECLPILKEYMPERDFDKLRVTVAPDNFLDAISSSPINEF